MITKLTDEQVKLMDEVKNEWLSLVFTPKKLDKRAAKKGINWLYEFSGLKKPMIIFVDSPLGAQIAVPMVRKIFELLKKGEVSQVRDQVWSQVWSQVREQVGSQVVAQVVSQVREQVWEQVRA